MFMFIGTSTLVPGLVGDGLAPPGVIIPGGLQAGDPTGTGFVSYGLFYGSVQIASTAGNEFGDDDLLQVDQKSPLTADGICHAVSIVRRSALNGHQFTVPAVAITDYTAGTFDILEVNSSSGNQFAVSQDGVKITGKYKTGTAVLHTLGAYSGFSEPVYDLAGTLLGYRPLYA